MPRHYSHKIPKRIDSLLSNDLVKMNKWAYSTFLPSLKTQYEKKGSITHKQYEILSDIEEQFSEENAKNIIETMEENAKIVAEERVGWEKRYEEIKEDVLVVAEYYRKYNELNVKNYFHQVLHCVFESKTTPGKSSCLKMISGPYALKVLEAWKKEPSYPVGTTIQPRRRLGSIPKYRFGFVLKTNVETPNSVKGGKKYLILPIGENKGLVVEERYLKKYKNKQ